MAKYPDKKRFEGNKPLRAYPTGSSDEFTLKYNKFEMPKEFNLLDTSKGVPIDLGERKIVFGVKAKEEELVKYDFVWSFDGVTGIIVHNRVLEKLNELCPKDFQALQIVIKNLDQSAEEKFENRDFWLINILQKRRIFDEKCMFYIDRMPEMNREIFIDGSMGDALLAREEIIGLNVYTFFHPSLAKHFIKSKGVQFLTDEEASLGRKAIGITEEQKERYEGRWSLSLN